MNGGSVLTRVCVLALALALGACGFQLRGAVDLPPALEVAYLESKNLYSGVTPAIRVELLSAGAEITEDRDQATGVLNIIGERSERRVLSVGSSGRASEYELFEEVTFAVLDAQGQTLLPQQTVRITRDFVFDENQLLGKVSEAEQIRGQMRRTLARQILTRIAVGMGQP
jgi:LPS-assembly lipoprotein